MQKTLTVAVFAAALGIGGAACAADLNAARSMKDPQAYIANTWSGFYVGVNGGYGWSAQSSTLDTTAYDGYGDGYYGYDSAKLTKEGAFGGGQIGYNIQRDRLVYGIEFDIQAADIKGSKSSEASADEGDVITDAQVKSSLDWFGTLRGRVGYLFGNSLLYATGGLAFGGVNDSLSMTANRTYPYEHDSSDVASKNTTLTGYAVGGGFETPLTPSLTFKAEYLYLDLGSSSLSTYAEPHGYDYGAADVKVDHTYHTVRVGLNYKLAQPYEPLK
jgi:outer membrane immunogenic protein